MRRARIGAVLAMLWVVTTACQPIAGGQAQPGFSEPAPAVSSSSPTVTESPSQSTSPTPAVTTPAPPPPPPPPPPGPCERDGQYQAAVETALIKLGGYAGVTADGKQSKGDCDAIKAFQKRFGLSPADGIAGPATNNVATRLAATDPAACGAGAGLVACIDLTNQTTWLMQDGALSYGPTVTRTGMKGFATRAGKFKIGWRAIKDWSEPYEVWLPYWQSVDGGNGFHETTTYIHNSSIGSHGCINLLHVDAVAYWDRLRVGTPVYAIGKRPGT
jgi:hypothetical protein